MAQPLAVEFDKKQFVFQLQKIDRSQLYGFKDIETLDEEGKPCNLATIAEDGRTMIGSGGVSIAYLTSDGEWRDKSELKPVDTHGNEVKPVPSTFKTTSVLEPVSINEYLSYNIRSVYLVQSENNIDELAKNLKSGTIYSFPFSFRESLDASSAFLVASEDGDIFLTVGKKTDIQYIGFEQFSDIETEESEAEEEDNEMDFGMM
ncbi:MAG: hypothetical protein H7A23_17470 [Leptospiraceae bacterium]|nr:hypothetical protein [Leptospiraceae bacterium]